MISFEEFLTESNAEPLLNEAVTFKADSDTTMIGSLSEFAKWYRNGYGKAFTTDGKFAFRRNRSGNSSSLTVIETGSYGKSGNSNYHNIRIDVEADYGDFIGAITSLDGIMDTARDFEKKDLVTISTSTIKNMSADAFTPVLLKNFKSVGSIAKLKKVTKAQARKIVASGDFHSISHNYQMRDDNHSTDGDVKLSFSIIADILSDLDSKHTVIFNREGSESFTINVHSNLSYYVNR